MKIGKKTCKILSLHRLPSPSKDEFKTFVGNIPLLV